MRRRRRDTTNQLLRSTFYMQLKLDLDGFEAAQTELTGFSDGLNRETVKHEKSEHSWSYNQKEQQVLFTTLKFTLANLRKHQIKYRFTHLDDCEAQTAIKNRSDEPQPQ